MTDRKKRRPKKLSDVMGEMLTSSGISDRIAQAVSGQFEAMTGRKLEVLGEIKPRLWPSLGVTTGPVSIANAEWVESDQPLLRAEGLSIDVNLGALLGGEVKILGLTADRLHPLERPRFAQLESALALAKK